MLLTKMEEPVAQMNEADPIWGEVPADVYDWDYGGRKVRSERVGGAFEVSASVLSAVKALSPIDKVKLTSWIWERTRFGDEEWPRITKDVLDEVKRRRPLAAANRMDRLLEYLAIEGYRPGHRPTWLGSHLQSQETRSHRQKALVWTECADDKELNGIRDLLVGDGLLVEKDGNISVTAAGFRRMEELERSDIPTDQVFVAMWFNEDTKDAYFQGISAAITAAGYRPLRIDQKEHANKIDDEIIAEIRRSRFVVADFTCGTVETADGDMPVPRGGVYYEAGFAQGRGIPVIWSVRADQINDVHFDTRQYNHIAWKDPEELRTKLFNRVGAIFGHRADAPGL